MPISCRYCGRTDSLLTDPYVDEDGFRSDELVDLCEYCVDHHEDRARARAEWNYYHDADEPCPEVELPQPAPRRTGNPQ